MTPKAHKEHHVELHAALDELVGDWLIDTGKLPSKSSIAELMQWSHTQTLTPKDVPIMKQIRKRNPRNEVETKS